MGAPPSMQRSFLRPRKKKEVPRPDYRLKCRRFGADLLSTELGRLGDVVKLERSGSRRRVGQRSDPARSGAPEGGAVWPHHGTAARVRGAWNL
eukprot:52466-Prymnesium_polylepis.1